MDDGRSDEARRLRAHAATGAMTAPQEMRTWPARLGRRIAPIPHRRDRSVARERLFLLLIVGLMTAYAAPSLWYGFVWIDDIQLLTADLFGEDSILRRFLPARPLQILSYPLVSAVSDTALAHRLFGLVLLLACVVLCFQAAGRHRLAGAILLAVFWHPAFIFPITWISQRNDLFLIAFTALMLMNLHRRRGLAYLVLSDLSKSPFLLQTLLFAWRAWTGRRWLLGIAVALAAAGLMTVAVYCSYYLYVASSETEHGLWAVTFAGPSSFALVVAGRAAKMLEGAVLALIPFPAFYGTAFLPVAVTAYILVWGIVLRLVLRGEMRRSERSTNLLLTGLLMLPPLAFASQLRIVPPVVTFLFLGLFTSLRPSPALAAAVVLLACVNLAGSLLNYGVTDTGCYDLAMPNAEAACVFRDTPVVRYETDRNMLRDELITWLKTHA